MDGNHESGASHPLGKWLKRIGKRTLDKVARDCCVTVCVMVAMGGWLFIFGSLPKGGVTHLVEGLSGPQLRLAANMEHDAATFRRHIFQPRDQFTVSRIHLSLQNVGNSAADSVAIRFTVGDPYYLMAICGDPYISFVDRHDAVVEVEEAWTQLSGRPQTLMMGLDRHPVGLVANVVILIGRDAELSPPEPFVEVFDRDQKYVSTILR